MTLYEAYYSGYRFRHKNWCDTCWKENKGLTLRMWIAKESGATDEELFSNKWVIEKFKQVRYASNKLE